MRHAWTILALACAGTPASTTPPPLASEEPEMTLPEPISCCASHEDLERLDGQRVAVVGRYAPTFLAKRPGKAEELARQGKRPSTVAIETDGASLMLEIYYSAAGHRSREEIERFSGQRVRVVGVLHRRTPTQRTESGIEMQTMIGPYIGEIESIEIATH